MKSMVDLLHWQWGQGLHCCSDKDDKDYISSVTIGPNIHCFSDNEAGKYCVSDNDINGWFASKTMRPKTIIVSVTMRSMFDFGQL